MLTAVIGYKRYKYVTKDGVNKEGATFSAIQPSGEDGLGFTAVEFKLPYSDVSTFSQAPAMYDLEFDFVAAYNSIVPVLKSAKFVKPLNFDFLTKNLTAEAAKV